MLTKIKYSKPLFYRSTKKSHDAHSTKSDGTEALMNNESDKDEACIRDLMLLRKTWLNMTRRIENIKRSLDRLRQGLVTFAMAKKAQTRMHHIEDDLSGILEDISMQRKLSGFEYALGNIMTQVLTLDFIFLVNNKFTPTPFFLS